MPWPFLHAPQVRVHQIERTAESGETNNGVQVQTSGTWGTSPNHFRHLPAGMHRNEHNWSNSDSNNDNNNNSITIVQAQAMDDTYWFVYQQPNYPSSWAGFHNTLHTIDKHSMPFPQVRKKLPKKYLLECWSHKHIELVNVGGRESQEICIEEWGKLLDSRVLCISKRR
jgi:hypothetical protein